MPTQRAGSRVGISLMSYENIFNSRFGRRKPDEPRVDAYVRLVVFTRRLRARSKPKFGEGISGDIEISRHKSMREKRCFCGDFDSVQRSITQILNGVQISLFRAVLSNLRTLAERTGVGITCSARALSDLGTTATISFGDRSSSR